MNDICTETCIVIDHAPPFLEDSGAKLELDINQKNKNLLSLLSNINKSSWTCVVEGVIEYCRIIYDIFTSNYKVSFKKSLYNFFCFYNHISTNNVGQ